jgi:hypothetical protein
VAQDDTVAAVQDGAVVVAHEVRRRLRVEDEQERKKLNCLGYIKIRSPVNPMRQRKEHWCKSRVSRRTKHRLNHRWGPLIISEMEQGGFLVHWVSTD